MSWQIKPNHSLFFVRRKINLKSKFEEDEPLRAYLFSFLISFVISFDTSTIWRYCVHDTSSRKKLFVLEGLVGRNFRRNFVNYEKVRLSGEI